MTKQLPLGPLLIDITGTELSAVEREILTHPLVGGVILFTRNYANREQLIRLIQELRALRSPRLLISVDHEGGRVQRWREGFTAIPAMGTLGDLYHQLPANALERAYQYGQTAAKELVSIGVDLNYAPVLDINYGVSTVINGGRSFHSDPNVIAILAQAYIQGLNSLGMQAIGKHFPGHGGVVADSHYALPEERRSLDTLLNADVVPFQTLIAARLLGGIMTAHIIYPGIDNLVATVSPFWLQQILRQRLKFTGAIISDDLRMDAMQCLGDYPQRVRKALAAGCDLVLLCNNSRAVDEVLGSMDAWFDTTQIVQKLYAQS
jgi:beta-N-acetylhexosaminidase